MKTFFRAIVAACMAVTPTTFADDLWAVYQTALLRDAAYQVAAAEYEAARLAFPLAQSVFRPTLRLSARASQKNADDGTTETEQSTLSAGVKILDRESRAAARQAKIQVTGAEIRFADARADLILRVAGRYFELLAALDNREVVRRQQAAIRRQMDLASERLEVGLGTQTDLFDAQARFQQSVADLIQAGNRIDNAAQQLKEITGQPAAADALAKLSFDAPLARPIPDSAAAWVARALADNRAIQVEDSNLKVAEEEIKKTRAARWPTIDLEWRQDWRGGGDGTMMNGNASDDDTVTATLNVPLYSGGAFHLKSKEAGYRYNAAESMREQTRRRVESDATSAYLAVVSDISRVAALSKAIVAGESALRAKQEGFRAGLTTNIDVLDAQRDLSQTQTNHLAARYDFILSTLRLERAVGDLDEADVIRINGWLVE